jgi:hypothetical protein
VHICPTAGQGGSRTLRRAQCSIQCCCGSNAGYNTGRATVSAAVLRRTSCLCLLAFVDQVGIGRSLKAMMVVWCPQGNIDERCSSCSTAQHQCRMQHSRHDCQCCCSVAAVGVCGLAGWRTLSCVVPLKQVYRLRFRWARLGVQMWVCCMLTWSR